MYNLGSNQQKSYCINLVLKTPCETTEQNFSSPKNRKFHTAADNQLICCCWYLARSKRINYKVLSETGEKERKVNGEAGDVEDVEVGEISNLLTV